MKNVIIIITVIISVITFSSCGNNVKEQRLIEMRDSIQAQIDWKVESIQEMDSLANEYIASGYLRGADWCTDQIDILVEKINDDRSKLFQIELELNK